jgi:hypothetical protein
MMLARPQNVRMFSTHFYQAAASGLQDPANLDLHYLDKVLNLNKNNEETPVV